MVVFTIVTVAGAVPIGTQVGCLFKTGGDRTLEDQRASSEWGCLGQ
ncbi:hypothetical protein PC116_g28804 [Phytophthora cactorum]|nr:hypothetical protein PC116_g28804 [Phytophthora cactorum]